MKDYEHRAGGVERVAGSFRSSERGGYLEEWTAREYMDLSDE